jgi:uncharacterized phage-like protein YoqJ
MTDVILAGTGHRPNKLNNEYDLTGPLTRAIARQVYLLIDHLHPIKINSGMALGFDMILAICAIRKNVPVDAYIPFQGQELKWPRQSQELYRRILEKKLVTPIIVCDGEYVAWKMQKRNEAMVNAATDIVACWDGTEGGTGNCVKYAMSTHKPIHRINPRELFAWQDSEK